MISLNACVTCNDISGTLVQVTCKGLDTFIQYCELRASNDLGDHQDDSSTKMFVHKDCRRDFTKPKRVKTSINSSASEQGLSTQNLRSKQTEFDWKTKCLFCAEFVETDDRHPGRNPVHQVATLVSQETIKRICMVRADNWGE